MKNARKFTDKLRQGKICLGTAVSLVDPTVCEALCADLDFFWIDMEHSSLSLEQLKCHLMAMKGNDAAALVRVPWNDQVLVKPVLDLGADGVIVPMVRNAADVAKAVAACKYPPEGVRGFGPLRPLDYGRGNPQQFCDESNDNIVTIVQIEQIDAVENIDEILKVPGLTSIAFGPQDLASSMGLRTQPRHPSVIEAMETVIAKSQQAKIPVGVSVGDDPQWLCELVDMGIQWLSMGADITLMLRATNEVAGKMREYVENRTKQ